MRGTIQKSESVIVTDTYESRDAPLVFWKLRTRFFAQNSDHADPRYCFATLFQTVLGFPMRPIATYRVLKKDRNHQTWYFWQFAGFGNPKPKILSGQKAELRQDQVRWVKWVYWYAPSAWIALVLAVQAVGYAYRVLVLPK